MGAIKFDVRQQRGLCMFQTLGHRIVRVVASKYLVPSQSESSSGYVVDAQECTCTCEDFAATGQVCKHIWSVRYLLREVETPGVEKVMSQEVRPTYPQDWASYNRAQCEERHRVETLLRELCDGIVQPPQAMGRPRLALKDVVFGAVMKVFLTFSGRRATSGIRDCETRGLVELAPHYNSIFRAVESDELTPLLMKLVEESAAPVKVVERNFAIDATGFTTSVYGRWFDHRYGKEKRFQKWVKLHCVTGCLTNIITSARVTEGHANDSPELPSLVRMTAENGFRIEEMAADKAYLGNDNIEAIESVGASPYIPFKSNSQGKGPAAWERMWLVFSLQREEFLEHYHRRSNVEATFSMLKRKFGGSVRSRLLRAQYNEVLLKCICHNLSVLVHAIHELGLEPTFWNRLRVAT